MFDSIIRFLWDWFGWWLGFIFILFCITDSLFGKDYKNLK